MWHIKTQGKRKKILLESFILLAYSSLMILVMYYHEPWFDEAQAWLIARDATIKEIVGSISHYEGHPPLWFILLMPIAKSGISYELGIKVVNLIIVSFAMGIFIFKAPFTRWIRCTIPFTYFFFYQYGVISRPYSLMMLGLVLSAATYKNRNKKPFWFLAALLLICTASAYGIVIVAGIAMVWLWELLGSPFSASKLKQFLKSRSFNALLLLLIVNIVLLLCIYPYPDTYAINLDKKSAPIKFLYLLVIAPADATCSYGYGGTPLQVIICIVITALIYVELYQLTGIVKKRALFILPYAMFAGFGGIVYFSIHHMGIIALFYMFLLWVCFDELTVSDKTLKCSMNSRLYYIGYAFICVSIGISIYWSISASKHDIELNYGTGRETAKYITEYGLEEKIIFVAWHKIGIINDVVNNDVENKDDIVQDYNFMEGVPTAPYFEKNIFYNFNNQQDNKCYLLHKINTDNSYMNGIIKTKYPEILIGTDDVNYTFGSEIDLNDFVLVKEVQGNSIWKSHTEKIMQYIYIRKDLLYILNTNSTTK